MRHVVVLDDTDNVVLEVTEPGDGDLSLSDVCGGHHDARTQTARTLEVGDGMIHLHVGDGEAGKLDGSDQDRNERYR